MRRIDSPDGLSRRKGRRAQGQVYSHRRAWPLDQPSNLNNVETWANVPVIINRGVDWYTSIGTPGSKGTKIFSLVGKITIQASSRSPWE